MCKSFALNNYFVFFLAEDFIFIWWITHFFVCNRILAFFFFFFWQHPSLRHILLKCLCSKCFLDYMHLDFWDFDYPYVKRKNLKSSKHFSVIQAKHILIFYLGQTIWEFRKPYSMLDKNTDKISPINSFRHWSNDCLTNVSDGCSFNQKWPRWIFRS